MMLTRKRVLDLVGLVGCLGFLGGGLAYSPVCDGGIALILFGIAVAFLGLVLFREGAWATVIPIAIVTLTLVGGGVYGASVGGCGI